MIKEEPYGTLKIFRACCDICGEEINWNLYKDSKWEDDKCEICHHHFCRKHGRFYEWWYSCQFGSQGIRVCDACKESPPNDSLRKFMEAAWQIERLELIIEDLKDNLSEYGKKAIKV